MVVISIYQIVCKFSGRLSYLKKDFIKSFPEVRAFRVGSVYFFCAICFNVIDILKCIQNFASQHACSDGMQNPARASQEQMMTQVDV